MIEQWRDVVNYEGHYQVSNLGRIRRLAHKAKDGRRLKKEMLAPSDNGLGYLQIGLHQNGTRKEFYVHRLVLQAFDCAYPPGMQANHKDGNRSNNCITNLKWVSPSENQLHAFRELGKPSCKGEKSGRSKLLPGQVLEIRRLYAAGKCLQRELAEQFNVARSNIGAIVNRKSWKHI